MSEYQVALKVFEGPLDLLLRLIEREELDITLVSLAMVADQYLAYIADLRHRAAADLADFLVIAARLLLIKSRVLLPRPEDEEEEEDSEDLATDLVQRLREYRRFKQAAQALQVMAELGRRTFPRLAPPPQVERRLKPGDVTVDDLAEAFRKVLESHAPAPPVGDIVSAITVHMGDCISNILDRVRRYQRVRFSTLMRQARSRLEVIVTFLAMLELIKQQRLTVTQERPFGEIYIQARELDPQADVPPLDLSDYES